MKLVDDLQYRILKRIAPREPDILSGGVYAGKSKLETLLGPAALADLLSCETALDFGCGRGEDAVELARRGCRHVIGVDIQERYLIEARSAAADTGVSSRCEFRTVTTRPVDAIYSLDAFEHFAEPATVLEAMHRLLKPGGRVYASFGPTWYHPLGGHLFSVFPWAHLIFSERALLEWRAELRNDGATRFSEVAGGLNQMSIRRFERLVGQSPLTCESLECVPIRKLHPIHNRLTREFTSAVVRATLNRPGSR
jgi:SAM-dependent methyltransferase